METTHTDIEKEATAVIDSFAPDWDEGTTAELIAEEKEAMETARMASTAYEELLRGHKLNEDYYSREFRSALRNRDRATCAVEFRKKLIAERVRFLRFIANEKNPVLKNVLAQILKVKDDKQCTDYFFHRGLNYYFVHFSPPELIGAQKIKIDKETGQVYHGVYHVTKKPKLLCDTVDGVYNAIADLAKDE